MRKMPFAVALLAITPTLGLANPAPLQPMIKSPPAEASTSTPTPAPVPTSDPAMINCQYQLPKATETIDQALVTTWAEKALIQSFQFAPKNLDAELNALKSCYTEQGWKAFNEALKTSGNLDAIRTNQLNVSSKIDGKVTVQDIKEKQWKVALPLNVTYQNKEKHLRQALNVEMLIALKKSGSFGIMQVIAVPK